MANIRPSSDLRNHYNEISEFCQTYNEPVFITKNGTGDLVVLSNKEYEYLVGKRRFHELIDEGLSAAKERKVRPAEEVFADLEKKHCIR